MDNKQSPKETRARRDTMSAAERQSLAKGYPVRPDADTQNYRNMNYRPREDSCQIPDYMRRGEVPVRNHNSSTKKPVPERKTATDAGQTPAHTDRTATLEISRKALQGRNQPPVDEDLMGETRTITRAQLHDTGGATDKKQDPMEKTTFFDHSTLHKTTDSSPSDTATGKKLSPHRKPKVQSKRYIPFLLLSAAVLVIAVLAVILPTVFRQNTPSVDYDMSEGFAPDALTVPDTETKTETDPTDTPDSSVNDSAAEETETVAQEVKFNVTLTFFDRDPITVSTGRITLGELLEKVGYTVRDTDKFPLDLREELIEDATIAVDTVTYTTATETIAIPYSSRETEVQTIPRGTKEIAQYGQNGEKTITYNVTICNGEEISREKTGESITKYPVEEISTVGVGGTLVGSDGNTYSYSYYKVVSATYYDIEGITYLGYNADESVVATDLNYIPMGTKLYVKSDSFDFGVRTAADTGSMINGWEVDIWLSDSNPQKAAFAKGGYWTDMRVYFLD